VGISHRGASRTSHTENCIFFVISLCRVGCDHIGGKLHTLDKWQSIKAAVLHADDDESESVHGMKKMRSLKNPSEGATQLP
jgi:hypothetical protein